MARSLILAFYLAVAGRADGFAQRKLQRRLAAGKEDPARLDERLGKATVPRPPGTLVWFHAASVGEVLSLIELIRHLGEERADLNFLVTTGTVTSATMFTHRAPPRTLHQYAPVDTRAAVRAFLDHWRPNAALWTESEFWPTMMVETHARGIPMMLVNARMSDASARRWRLLRGAAKSLLSRFEHVLAQEERTAQALVQLGLPGDRVEVTGTLKEGATALPCDESERAHVAAAIGQRPVWLAASTHPGEEEIAAAAHRRVMRAAHGALLIVAPRHPDRGVQVARDLAAEGFRVALRSAGAVPEKDTQVYIADTLGEMGLWFRVAPVSFVAGSLVDVGGHNPFEPAALGSAIIHGPHVANFADIFQRLGEARAAVLVRDAGELAEAVIRTSAPEVAAEMAMAAWEICSAGADVTDRVAAAILARLPEPA